MDTLVKGDNHIVVHIITANMKVLESKHVIQQMEKGRLTFERPLKFTGNRFEVASLF
jgi:hypothetical protein